MAQSRFISLSQYCVVEYQFEQLNSVNFYSDDFILIDNTAVGSRQIFNTDASYLTLRNIQDVSVVQLPNNKYAYLDSEKVPNYLQYNSDLIQTPITGYNVVMDRVRFHFISGFDFDTFKALVLSISHKQNNGIINTFANILLSPETISQLITFNAKPLFLSNAVYDRFVDIMVPSIKNINEEYVTSPVPTTTFVAAITPDENNNPVGFAYNEPLTISLSECGKKSIIYTNSNVNYDSYDATNVFTATLAQTNEFDGVGASINESSVGDYLEFYLTYNSGFPGELLSILNRRNPVDDWIIVHQLSIFEQVGSTFINTGKLVFFQEELYDEPNVFRPVLKYASEAISMSVDYIARLTNRRNGEQIIREGSFSLISPKKYGKKLTTIPLLDKPQSQRVYNKIVKNNFEATNLFVEPAPIGAAPIILQPQASLDQSVTQPVAQVTEIVRTEYIPIFFNNNNISISKIDANTTVQDATEEVIFAPGKLRFILSPFDNVLKLKIFTESSKTNSSVPLVPLDLNINSAKYRLVFELDSGKVSIDNVNDSQLENLSTGRIAFNVSKKDSETIVQSSNRTLYLTSVSQDGRETLMYTGEWRKPSEQADVDAAVAEAKIKAAASLNKIDEFAKISAKMDEIKINDLNSKIELDDMSVRPTGVAPIVNRFGIPNAKSIRTDYRSTKAQSIEPSEFIPPTNGFTSPTRDDSTGLNINNA